MDEYDLWQEIQAKTKQLDTCIESVFGKVKVTYE